MANWKKTIPTVRDEQGAVWYHCDIGLPVGKEDSVDFSKIENLRITGNLYLGDDASLPALLVAKGVAFLGDNTYGGTIFADQILIGNDAEVDSLISYSNICVGHDFKGQNLVAIDTTTVGNHATISGSVYAGSDISISDRATVDENLYSFSGTVTVGNHSKIEGNVSSYTDIALENHCEVSGSITSKQGAISVNYSSFVGEAVTTSSSGTVLIGNFVELGGNVTTEDGDIVIGNYVDAENISSSNGTINCGHHLTADTISTNRLVNCQNPISKVFKFAAAGGMYLKN